VLDTQNSVALAKLAGIRRKLSILEEKK